MLSEKSNLMPQYVKGKTHEESYIIYHKLILGLNLYMKVINFIISVGIVV